MIKIFYLVLLIFAGLIFNVYSFSDGDFNYRHFNDSNLEFNKVFYEIIPTGDYNFEVEIYYQDEKISQTCSKQINRDFNILSNVIACEFPKYGDGEYVFDAVIQTIDATILKRIINNVYVFENTTSHMTFKIAENKTYITIDILGDDENIKVIQTIPRDVIWLLNDENKDSLIKSDIEYVILRENPLIAWNINKAPAKINYEINKEIGEDEQKKFKLEITKTDFQDEDNLFMSIIKYAIFGLILLIIFLIFRSGFKKNES